MSFHTVGVFLKYLADNNMVVGQVTPFIVVANPLRCKLLTRCVGCLQQAASLLANLDSSGHAFRERVAWFL